MLTFTLFNIEDKTILCNGVCPNEDCLPVKPEGYKFAFGIMGDPETQKVQVDIVEGEGVYSLVSWVRPREPEELLAAIETERSRRLAAGFDYNFKDARGVHRIGTTEADERGWDKVTKLASAMILSGNPGGKIQVVTETGPVEVTAVEWQEILIAAGAFQQPIYALSFALQTMTPIPQDVENPSYWGQN